MSLLSLFSLLLLLLILLMILGLLFVEQNRLRLVIQLHKISLKHVLHHHLEPSFLVDLKHYVFRLQIRVDDLAYPVQIIKPDQRLPRYFPHNGHRNAPIVVPLDKREQILPEDLESHD
jgi:hypothetical protein